MLRPLQAGDRGRRAGLAALRARRRTPTRALASARATARARAQAIQFEKRAKWDAWNTRKGMSKEDAIREYITEVDAQHAKYGDGP